MMFHDPYALSTTLGRCYRQTLQQADFILAVLPFAFSKNLLHLWFPSNFFLIVPLFFIQTWFSIHPPISTLGSVHLHSFFTIFFIVTHLSAMSIMFFFQKRAARCQSISPGLLFRGGCPKFQTAPRSLLVLHFCVISAIAAIANGFPLHGFVPDVCDPKCHSFTMFYAQCCGEWIARNSHPPGCIFFAGMRHCSLPWQCCVMSLAKGNGWWRSNFQTIHLYGTSIHPEKRSDVLQQLLCSMMIVSKKK